MVELQGSAAHRLRRDERLTSKIRPGGWYELWSFALGGSSVALGIGFMEPSCKVNIHKGFIEFNPNKVAGDKRFHGLLKTLGTCVSKARLKRFDLAYDIPVSRYDCRLSKDRRMYKSVISNGITEYLGSRTRPHTSRSTTRPPSCILIRTRCS